MVPKLVQKKPFQKRIGASILQLCSMPLLHCHELVDAHMAEQHNSTGWQYFSAHIRPPVGRCNVLLATAIRPLLAQQSPVRDEFQDSD